MKRETKADVEVDVLPWKTIDFRNPGGGIFGSFQVTDNQVLRKMSCVKGENPDITATDLR
jgi:hypothetical protein